MCKEQKHWLDYLIAILTVATTGFTFYALKQVDQSLQAVRTQTDISLTQKDLQVYSFQLESMSAFDVRMRNRKELWPYLMGDKPVNFAALDRKLLPSDPELQRQFEAVSACDFLLHQNQSALYRSFWQPTDYPSKLVFDGVEADFELIPLLRSTYNHSKKYFDSAAATILSQNQETDLKKLPIDKQPYTLAQRYLVAKERVKAASKKEPVR
ncbi:MAG: hypothetical protein ACOYON_11215 [Fimbriimonas sp.]